MGRTHFPPPESSPRSNRQPKRRVPGNQRVEAKPQNHLNSRPSTPPSASNWKNRPNSRPPTDKHGNSNFSGAKPGNYAADYRRAPPDSSTGRQSSNRGNTIGGMGHDHPVKFEQRDHSLTTDRRNPSEVRLRLPEKFYSQGGESFADVMKKPAPIVPRFQYSGPVAQSEGEQHADQIVGKPFNFTEFPRSTGNGFGTASTVGNQILSLNLNQNLNHFDQPNPLVTDPADARLVDFDEADTLGMAPADKIPVVNESILNLNLQDLNQFDRHNPSVMDRPGELPIVKESARKESIWGAGSFVEVLRKPAPITPQIDAPTAPQQFEGQRRPHVGGAGHPPMNSAGNASTKNDTSKNSKNRDGHRYQTRYYVRNDRSSTRGRKMAVVEKPNRKENHSRGEESSLDAAKKKIRTPELHVPSTFEQVEYQPLHVADLPKFTFTETGNSSAFIIGNANGDANGSGGCRKNADPKDPTSLGFGAVNAPVANTSMFVDGIFHRRSFVDVVRRGAQSEVQAGGISSLPDPSIYQA